MAFAGGVVLGRCSDESLLQRKQGGFFLRMPNGGMCSFILLSFCFYYYFILRCILGQGKHNNRYARQEVSKSQEDIAYAGLGV